MVKNATPRARPVTNLQAEKDMHGQLVSAAKYAVCFFGPNFHLQRQRSTMSLTAGLTRIRDTASPPVPVRAEKRPRLELSEQDEAVIEPDMLFTDEDVTTAATVDAAKVTNIVTKNKKRKQKHKRPVIEPYSSDDVLYHDVVSLLKNSGKVVEPKQEWDAPLPLGTEVELLVSELSSTGMHF